MDADGKAEADVQAAFLICVHLRPSAVNKMILAQPAIEQTPSATVIGLWVIAAGIVIGILLNGVRLWKSLQGEPERRAVNVLAENATKDELRGLAAEIRDLDRDVRELRAEMKIDREALSKTAAEQGRMLNDNIQDVLAAVSELRGSVDVIRDKTTRA
jgi:uncharacterized protein YlxW (UPF0749 family)